MHHLEDAAILERRVLEDIPLVPLLRVLALQLHDVLLAHRVELLDDVAHVVHHKKSQVIIEIQLFPLVAVKNFRL